MRAKALIKPHDRNWLKIEFYNTNDRIQSVDFHPYVDDLLHN